MTDETIIEHTRRWIDAFVIGLGLCPFARRVFDADKIRYAVSIAREPSELLADLARELRELAAAPLERIETTILIHPHVLEDFLAYNDFLEVAEELIEDLNLAGTIQIASFHPEYQFAESASDAVENYTNRSPYPMLHLLREASITAVASCENDLLEIPKRNVRTLKILGLAEVQARLKALTPAGD